MPQVTQGYVWASGETVTPTKLNNAATPTVTLADGEITTSKILDAAVTANKLAAGAVTGDAGGGKLAPSVITAQTAIDSLAGPDQLLVHDDSTSALRRVTWTQILSVFQAPGSIVKTVSSSDALSGWQNLGSFTVAGPLKTIPLDNTAPQSDEGAEIATVTITPTFANSTIRLFASISGIAAGAGTIAIASLFRGATASAFRTAWRYVGSSSTFHGEMSLLAEDAPATTSSVTYRLRLGPSTAIALYIGGQNTNATSLGDTGKVVLIAQEIKA